MGMTLARRRLPALQALTIQSISFLIVLAAAHLLPGQSQFLLTIGMAALLQGAIAAGISRLAGMPAWWQIMQFLFAPALLAAQSLQLPSWIYLVVFLSLAALYWNVHRTQVPFYPSGRAVWRAVAELLPAGRPLHCIDIGSGLGGLPMHLSRIRGESHFTGIELAPLPWFVSRVRSRLAGGRARFLRGDYNQLDLSAYDVVFAYLSPAAMPDLWRKAQAEMRAGTLLLSYEFPIPDVPPDIIRS
ncbi:class I SAM-dependent methyltransferase, partial [Noviherbaspirillum sp.]|uniref:class I SAM-dependent methyltransferase n=1 Tax=Noviherbaspirillum sp. TaxID=1926288 RepID=UPI002FE39E66